MKWMNCGYEIKRSYDTCGYEIAFVTARIIASLYFTSERNFVTAKIIASLDFISAFHI